METNILQGKIKEAEKIMWKSPKEALEMANKVYKQMSVEDDSVLYLETLFCISRASWILGDFSNSLIYAYDLVELAKELNNDEMLGKGHLITGSSYVYMKSYQRSLDHFLKAKELSTKCQDFETLSSSLNNIGEIYNDLKDYNKAQQYYEQSKALSVETGNKRGMGVCYLNLADIAFKKNDKELALEYLEIALKNNYEVNDYIGIAYTVSLEADILSSNNDYDAALERLNEAKGILSETEDKYNLILVNERLLDVYKFTKQDEKFEKIALESLNIAIETDTKERIATFAFLLSEFYDEHDDLEKAYKYIKIGYKYRQISFDEIIEQHKKNVEIQFRINKTENENQIISAYNEKLSSKNDELTNLYENIKKISEIGKDLTSTLESHEIYQMTYEYLQLIAPVDFFGISLYDEKTTNIKAEFYISKGEVVDYGEQKSRSKSSLARYCIVNKKSILSDDLQKDYMLYKDNVSDPKIHSVIYVPLILDEKVLGAMTIQSEEVKAYGAKETSYMEALSSYFAIAIVNARFSESLKEEAIEREKSSAALGALNKQLLELSRIDSLTQIPNRRRFQEFLDDLLKMYTRNSLFISVMLVDVDYFKQYNDNYGHLSGDRVLQEVAEVLEISTNRDVDFIARYGGDEFVVILPNTDSKGCELVAKKIIDNIRKKGIEHLYSKSESYVTLTIGAFCDIPSKFSTIESVIHEADVALYKAKDLGRNRFIIVDNGV